MFHVFTSHLVRQRSMFERAGEPGIFAMPEPREELGIFLSPREETDE